MKMIKKYSTRPVLDVYAKLVRQGDDFQLYIKDGKQTFDFKPLPFNDGAIIGAFAVILYKDGGLDLEEMSLKELEKVRSKSKMANGMAWKDFTGEMYKKTVLHRLCKHIELEFDNPQQNELFDEDVAIETDTQKIVEQEIEENANQVDFSDVIDAEVVEG
jgi:recombination protein RecT